MNKGRIYISGPITGTDDYMERFAETEEKLTEKGWTVFNPAKVNAGMPEGTTYEEYMRVAFTLLDMADTICLMRGWEDSKGANREYCYALAKGKMIAMDAGEEPDLYGKAFDALAEFDFNKIWKGDSKNE